MIQRIQTLWLALATCCMAVCLFAPVSKYVYADIPTEGQRVEAQLNLFAKGEPTIDMLQPVVQYSQHVTGMRTWPLVMLVVLCGAIAVASIFLFRKRTLQMRLVAVGFLLNVVYAFLLFFWAVDKYADLLSAGLGGAKPEIIWFVGAFAPLLSLIFFFLAQRAIRKDEALVRAADRLR